MFNCKLTTCNCNNVLHSKIISFMHYFTNMIIIYHNSFNSTNNCLCMICVWNSSCHFLQVVLNFVKSVPRVCAAVHVFWSSHFQFFSFLPAWNFFSATTIMIYNLCVQKKRTLFQLCFNCSQKITQIGNTLLIFIRRKYLFSNV
jgi:hypothetical protein